MKIVTITVSDREGSNSKYVAQIFANNANYMCSEINIEHLDLAQAKIMPYTDQRNAKNPEYPADDFVDCIQKIMHADTVIIFTPCYWFSHPYKLQTFMERFSQALRQFPDFKDKMHDKLWCVSVVSGAEPQTKVIYECHREICSYLNMKFLAGPWFVAYEANELEKKVDTTQTIEFIDDFIKQICDNFSLNNEQNITKSGC